MTVSFSSVQKKRKEKRESVESFLGRLIEQSESCNLGDEETLLN